MKKALKKILPCVLLLCASVHLCADWDEDEEGNSTFLFEKIPGNPTLTGYFTEVMNSAHFGMDFSPCVFYADMLFLIDDPYQMNLMAGFMIPVFPYVSIPVFGETIINMSGIMSTDADHSKFYLGWMVGGGLVIHGRFGVLAGYFGYSGIQEKLREDDAKGVSQVIYDRKWEKYQWAVFPVINAKEYPLLRSFVDLIDGYFNMDILRMDRDEFKPTYKANVLFRGIPLGKDTKISLGGYTVNDWYNSEAKYELHAGKLDFTFPLGYNAATISAEGGYRRYFDVQHNNQNYEDGIYSKLAFKVIFKYDARVGFTVFAESGSQAHFKSPQIGLTVNWLFNDETASRMNAHVSGGKGNSDMRSDIALNFRIYPHENAMEDLFSLWKK